MKKYKLMLLIVTALFFQVGHSGAQGFVNLNFEQAKVVYVAAPAIIVGSNAIPNWLTYYGTSNNPTAFGSPHDVYYNGVSLGGSIVALEDTNAIYGPLPLQGKYSILLQGSEPGAASTASIGQSSTIPSTAQSLNFFAYLTETVQVSFNGLNLPVSQIGIGTGYNIYGADISAYAAQFGQLLFTAPVNNSVLLDNIQFSTSAIPEPGTLVLTSLGAFMLAARGWRRNTA
jgi:hypothetical protein